MNQKSLHSMKIRDLSLQVQLGCSAEERSVSQEIRVNIELRFCTPPRGTASDNLKDTICYAKISEVLKEHLKEREFCLVEKIASDFHGLLKTIVEKQAQISLSVLKVRPPVDGLVGGVEYQIGYFA